MSYYERTTGKAVLIDNPECLSLNQLAKSILDNVYTEDEIKTLCDGRLYKNELEYLVKNGEFDEKINKKYIVFKNQLFELEDVKVTEADHQYCDIRFSTKGKHGVPVEFTFDTQYYNGGTCYEEMLEEKLEKEEKYVYIFKGIHTIVEQKISLKDFLEQAVKQFDEIGCEILKRRKGKYGTTHDTVKDGLLNKDSMHEWHRVFKDSPIVVMYYCFESLPLKIII